MVLIVVVFVVFVVDDLESTAGSLKREFGGVLLSSVELGVDCVCVSARW